MFSLAQKRQRVDGDFMDVDEDWGRVRKKPCPLLRTPPKCPRRFFIDAEHVYEERPPYTLTPVDSNGEEEGKGDEATFEGCPPRRDDLRASLRMKPPAFPLDTAMDLDSDRLEPLSVNTDYLPPWPVDAVRFEVVKQKSPDPYMLNGSSSISGRRVATPIYDHFTVNMTTRVMTTVADGAKSTDESHLRATCQDESDWWRCRQLPSPISESVNDFATVKDSSSGNVQCDSLPCQSSENSDISVIGTDKDRLAQVQVQQSDRMPLAMGKDSSVLLSAEKVSCRKGKISISMGYRADCDKCLRKVPGHYSHIIQC